MDQTESKNKNVKNHPSVGHTDSTRPVDEIVEYFEQNNPAAFRYYCKLLGRRTHGKFPHNLLLGHPLNTFHDDWDGMLPAGYFEKFLYKGSLPKVLTAMHNICTMDPVTEILNVKATWESQRHCSNLKSDSKLERINDKVVVCLPSLVCKAVSTELDPDPNLWTSYNWYYSGHGNMHIFTLGDSDYILHSVLNCLYLSKFSKAQLHIDEDPVLQYDCGDGTYILETLHSDTNLVALRLKTRVIILKIYILENSIQIEKLSEIQSDIAYTSVSFDSYHKNILYVTTLDNKVAIVNTDLMKRRTIKLTETANLFDNWSMVIGSSANTYTHVSRKAIRIYDKRTNDIAQTWSRLDDISDLACNDFSIGKMCEGIPFMYAGTNHHLFLLDLRCFDSNKPNALQRWTHNMICPPTCMSLCEFESYKDLLCITSQYATEDLRILQNDSASFGKDLPASSISMMYRPPTIEFALNTARFNKLCLDIYKPLETRIYTAATGTALVETDDRYLVLTQNSLGDIFCHTLYPEHEEFDDDALERLHEWGKSIKNESKTFEITKFCDITDVWKSLKKIPSSHTFGLETLDPDAELKFSDQEVIDAFDRDKLDSGLLDLWIKDKSPMDVEPEELAINLHFSDSE